MDSYIWKIILAMKKYPRKLTFKSPDMNGLTVDAREHIKKVTEGTTITMLAENIIKIEYPAELIDHIKTVCVDNIDYRLDFIDHGNVYFMCNCYFPQGTGWGSEFFKNRWNKGKRTETPGCLIIEYPKKEY